jgi:DNA-binding Xre family transcriptional regulator
MIDENEEHLPAAPVRNPEGRNQHSDNSITTLIQRKALAAVMAEEGATNSEMIDATGLSSTTLTKIRAGGVTGVPEKMMERMRSARLGNLEVSADMILSALTSPEAMESKIEKASLRDLVAAASQIANTIELLAGRPTERIEVRSDQELHTVFNRLKATVQESIDANSGAIDAEYEEVDEGDIEPPDRTEASG